MEDRMHWYLQAKFGLFIHWGAYSVAGAEASWPIMTPDLSELMFRNTRRISEAEYTTLPGRFNPQKFDPRAWVRLAQEAGMRYIVFTSKHHDGFCMFDAPGTDYKITKTPYGKDICLELAEACAAAGMRLGFYYSPPDLHDPNYRDTRRLATTNWLGEPKRPEWSRYLDTMESHLRKLLTGYGKVSVLWFDALVNHQKFDPPRFHRLVHELSPETLINDRLGDDYDFITPEQFIPKLGIPMRTGKPPAGNQGGEGLFKITPTLMKLPLIGGWMKNQLKRYADGELDLTKVPQSPHPQPHEFQPWETCMTMGQSWGYNPQETTWKPGPSLVRNLVSVASKGGNYLLNVGPCPDGTFPPEAVERLRFVGQWMAKNSESIYGTTYCTESFPGFTGQVTCKENEVYLHISEWPASRCLELASFSRQVEGVSLLPGQELLFLQEGSGKLVIDLPEQAPDAPVSVIKICTRPG